MKKQTRAWMAMTMAVAMTAATISSVVPGNGITAEAASIRLSKTKLSLKVGQSKQLTVKGTKKAVKWSVSNGKIVKVTKKGKVTAKKAGTAKVFAKVKGKKLTCNVKVTAAPNQKATMSPSSSPAATGSTGSNGTKSSSAPKGTSTPTVTNTPTVTTGPAITPTATNTAKASEEPVKTSDPKKTEIPVETEDPEYTKGPIETEDPEYTKGPVETEVPVLTPSAQPTETPEVEKITIKSGETKNTTVDGIKFTYKFEDDYCYVKMENTSKDAKFVDWNMQALNADGKVVEKVEEENYYLAYLETGKTVYENVYFCNDDSEEDKKATSCEIYNIKIQSDDSEDEDYLSDITIDSQKGEMTKEKQSVTFKYNGDDSVLDENKVILWGTIVYYDSKDNIDWIDYIMWEISGENNMQVTEELQTKMDDRTRYEVILSGAYLEELNASDEPTIENVKIKVGEEKSVTLYGVKYTYYAQKEQMFIKIENTDITDKIVQVEAKFYDSEGELKTYQVRKQLHGGKTSYEVIYNSQLKLSEYTADMCVEEVEYAYTNYFDAIEVTPEEGENTEDIDITLRYTDSFTLDSDIEVNGSVVYYDSMDNIVGVETISEKIDKSKGSVVVDVESIAQTDHEDADHYKVFLSSAYYYWDTEE